MKNDEQTWYERGLRDAVLAGDEGAWRALYDRYFASAFAYVHYRTGRKTHQTEDVVQESWLIAVRRMRDFDPARGTFEAWLRGIADNVLRGDRRRSSRRRRLEAAAPSGRAGPAESTEVFESARDVDLAEQIAVAMSGLPVRYQEVLRAKYDEDLPVAEIALRTERTSKAVESLLSRARALFREAYHRIAKER